MSPLFVALAAAAALALAMGVGRFAFTPLLPMMQADAGLTLAAAGGLASANYVGYLAGALAASKLRVSGSTAIRASLVLVGMTTLAMGWFNQIAAWSLLRFAAGVASAFALVHVSAWSLGRLAAAGATSLSATVYAGVGVGIALTGLACLLAMAAAASSALTWQCLGAAALIASAFLWPAFGGSQAQAPATSLAFRWSPEARRLVVAYGACGFGYILPATFLPAMAREAVPDPFVFGWSWPVFGLAAAASTFAAAAFAARQSDRLSWIVAQLTMAVGVAVPLAWPGLGGVIASGLLVGATFMVVTMAGLREARRIGGEHARALIAALTAAFATGQVAGPLVVSALAGRGDPMPPSLALAAVVLAASTLLLRKPR